MLFVCRESPSKRHLGAHSTKKTEPPRRSLRENKWRHGDVHLPLNFRVFKSKESVPFLNGKGFTSLEILSRLFVVAGAVLGLV